MRIAGKMGAVTVVDRSVEGSRGFISSYLVSDPQGGVAIIDPGPSRDVLELLEAVEALGRSTRDLRAIIVTHVHLDHGGGAGLLHLHAPWSKVYVHPRGAPHLADPSKLWASSLEILGETAKIYGEPVPIPGSSIKPVADGEELVLGELRLRFIHTPGHATHHVSVLLEPSKILFPGDSAGMHLCGKLFPTTPFPFKLHDALSSLDKMAAYNPRYMAYTHFGIKGGARQLIKQYRELLLRLADEISRLMDEGYRGRRLVEALRDVDDMPVEYEKCVRRLGAGYVSDHFELSVNGMERYVEKYGRTWKRGGATG